MPRSTFYHAAAPTATQLRDEELEPLIEEIFHYHKRRYGYRRIWQELRDRKVVCASSRVRRLMKSRGLKAIQPKTFVPKTSDGKANAPSPNLLLEEGLPERPDQALAGDITFIRAGKRWLYLAVVIDLCTRKIVGWSLADSMRSQLVIDALDQALQTRPDIKGAIFHSDRGSQYGSKAFRELLGKYGLRQSMSARANPYHNAWTESFIGTLKSEMERDEGNAGEKEIRTEIFEYIDGYYNTRRKHSSLDYKTPNEYEAAIAAG